MNRIAGIALLALLAISFLLIVVAWGIAISGFWNGRFLWTGLATGTVACAMALGFTLIFGLAVRTIWTIEHETG